MCKRHSKCKAVRYTGEFVTCPWCGYKVSTSNPLNWCANCYTLFKVGRGWVHFSKAFKPTFAQALAIAVCKSGGMSMKYQREEHDENAETAETV
jgi:hypothetical protein